jgi:histidinol dehydrogenase
MEGPGGLALKRIIIEQDGYEAALKAVQRSLPDEDIAVLDAVRGIIADVRARGDAALLELGRKFDSPALDRLEVSSSEWDAGCSSVEPDVRAALDQALDAIRAFHVPQRRSSWFTLEGGRITGQMLRPLDRVGVYVPGGRASYPSSVLMAAGPAAVAGVPDIRLCTPAGRDGVVAPSVLYAARIVGVQAVYKIGGAQAVAAMACGTATVPRVDKVVGPGNAYVCAAKKLLWGVADMDMIAGPSEVCVVADESADPGFVAADMLAQAEHDPECAAFLITPSASLAQQVEGEIEKQMGTLARRQTLQQALQDHGGVIVTRSLAEALEVANACAPEHLALMVRDPMAALASVRHAGAVILGHHTPQTAGDYLAGPSHVLPTGGTARFWSPLNVDTFIKKTSFIGYDAGAIRAAAASLTCLAEAEGFGAHANAAAIRVKTDDHVGRAE